MPTIDDDERLKELLFDDQVRAAQQFLSDYGTRLPTDKEIAEHLKVGIRRVRASAAFHDRVVIK
jgi:hypothetical protein